jgi:hypothetical protein
MQIRIISAEVIPQGKFKKVLLKYDQDGQSKSSNVVSFGDSAEAFKVLSKANAGEAYEIKMKKNGEYWNIVEASPVEGERTTVTSGTKAPTRSGNTYETPDERHRKQVYIVRQSSISAAISAYGQFAADTDTETYQQDILQLAETFERWVFRNNVITDDGEID